MSKQRTITQRRKLLPQERALFIHQAGNICIYCYRIYNPELARLYPKRFFDQWEIDHIKPLSKDGEDAASNMHAVCRRCNQLKSAMTYSEFIQLLRKQGIR